MSPLLLIVLYLAVALSPLALAWASGYPPRPLLDEIAAAAGMLAYAVILVEFVLSGRFRSVSRRIGMDVTMRVHQLLARTALALALIHPFLYVSPYRAPYPWDVTRLETVTSDLWALGGGIAAYLLLPSFVLLAIFRSRLSQRYEFWRLTHGLGALLIAALLLQHTLAAGRYAQDPTLAWLWTALFAIAAASLAVVYVLKPLAQLRRPWVVRSVRRAALRTWELTIEPVGHDGLRYEAGQFAWLNVGHSPFSLDENPFSISSAPGDGPEVKFLIKELGDFTSRIGEIEPGTRAHLDAPHGNLVVAGRAASGIALIAGGVGVAPLLGVLRQLRHDEDPRPTLLVYGNRVEDQIALQGELEDLVAAHGTRLVHVLSEPPEGWRGRTGMVTAGLMRELFEETDMRDWLFVVCGPAPMMEAVEDALLELGVPARRVISERFDYD